VIYEGDPEPEDAADVPLSEDQRMFESLFQENAETYAAYESTDNCFDMTNTKRFAGDIPCPPLDRTVIHRYIDYGNEDKWGKRKPEFQRVPVWYEQALTRSATVGGGEVTQVGLNILGPGGVQMTVGLTNGAVVSVERGLPQDSQPVLTLSAGELNQVLSGDEEPSIVNRGWEGCTEEQAAELSEQLVSALAGAAAAVVGDGG
jgi:hypothetical protein